MKRNKSDLFFNMCNMLFAIMVLIITLYPLIYVVSASLSDPDMVNSGKMWLLPKGFTLEGYRRVFKNHDIFIGYRNTIFYTVFGVLISLFITLPCAFALSHKEFQGKKLFAAVFMITMFVDGGLIPRYLVIEKLHLLDTIWAVLLPGAATMFNIIIAKNYFASSIPFEMQEAARIDGCNNLRTFFKIILPLSKPIIAILCLYYGIARWNMYFGAMIYLNDRNMYPLQLFLREILVVNEMAAEMTEDTGFADQARIVDMIKYCAIIVSTLPAVIGYLLVQKHLVQGTMIGAVKD